MSNNLPLNHRYINPDLVNFVKEEEIRILRDIEQFYSTQIDG